jgi:cell division protein FtsN
MTARRRSGRQGGGFAMGLIVGLLVGLVLALGVALYVTKVPVPFVNKVPQRTAEQDAAEAERNKNWDPNAGLAGKMPIKPLPGATASAPASSAAASGPSAAPLPNATAKPARDPAAILAGQAADNPAQPRSTKPGQEPYLYFVQAGAYNREDEAEQQRAKLAMLGFSAKVTEREQSGRTMYRVRLGPFETKGEAELTQGKLQASGADAAMVRVLR